MLDSFPEAVSRYANRVLRGVVQAQSNEIDSKIAPRSGSSRAKSSPAAAPTSVIESEPTAAG